MEKKINIPKKGAGRKWAARLKELGQQKPPQDFVDKINGRVKDKVASPHQGPQDLDME